MADTPVRRYLFNGVPICLHILETGEQCGLPALADEQVYHIPQRCKEHTAIHTNPTYHHFQRGKYGLTEDPRGAQVRMTCNGRTYLGDVRDAYRDDVTGSIRLKVYHFCGDPWPFDPPAVNVDVLIRDYSQKESA